MKTLVLLLSMFCLIQMELISQIQDINFVCGYNPQGGGKLLSKSAALTATTGTTNMAIILCVEKGQSRELHLDNFVNFIKEKIPDYFKFATYDNYHVNVLNVLVKSKDTVNRIAYAFELPDTLISYPGLDTSLVVQPWMVRNILAQADSVYNFADFDSNGDGIVDFLMFQVVKFHPNSNGSGCPGLSIDSYYTTNDSAANGTLVKIDGTGYMSDLGRGAIIQRNKFADAERIVSVAAHELGHALFSFPDMDHYGSTPHNHYSVGYFCAMSASGGSFSNIASVYNPQFRVEQGWLTPIPISTSGVKTFQDIDSTGLCYSYDLPYYVSSAPYQKFYLSYYNKPANNRWQSAWPIPKDAQNKSRGVLVWRWCRRGSYYDRYYMPLTIESAHGKWEWNNINLTLPPPNDLRAINTGVTNAIKGADSLQVRSTYYWQRFIGYDSSGAAQYEWVITYPDYRVGSESCFFDPLHPKVFSFYSNPNSNDILENSTELYSRSIPSDLKVTNLRLDNGSVKADFTIGSDAYIVSENATLSAGKWHFNKSVTVNSGITLTISPGSTISFASGAQLVVNGTLVAQGTTSSNIIFTSVSGTSPGSWGAIYFDGSGASNSLLQYCTVQYGHSIQCHNGANVTIDHCILQRNGYGVLSYDSDPTISNNQILYNVVMGISVIYGDPRIENNTITSNNINRGSGVRLYASGGYANSNIISGFYYGLLSDQGTFLRGYLPNNETPAHNNKLTENNYGISTDHQSYSIIGFQDYDPSGGNNWIENNVTADLGSYSSSVLLAYGNWYGSDFIPTTEKTPNATLEWSALSANPWGGQQARMENANIAVSALKKSTFTDSLNVQENQNKSSELKLLEEAILNYAHKFYEKAQIKCKQLLSSKKYSQSALVLLSHLERESNDKSIQAYFEDIKSNAVSNKVDKSNIPLITNLLANIYGRQADYSKAIALYDEVIKKFPNTPEERNARVQKIYYMVEGLKNKKGAEQQLNELVSLYADGGNDIEMVKDLVYYPLISAIDTSRFSLDKSSKQSTKDESVISEYSLSANYPNPFNPSTTIRYQLPKAGHVTLKIYDMLGREVATLVDGVKEVGSYTATFNGSGLSSGIYFVRFKAQPADGSALFTKTMKILMMK